MKKLVVIFIAIALLMAFILFWPRLWLPEVSTVRLANGAELIPTDCWFDTPWRQPTICAYLHTRTTSVDPRSVSVARFRMPVVIFPRTRWWPDPSGSLRPLLFLNGGPGNSSYLKADQIGYWFETFDQMQLDRDIVLFDQRGTGLSEPAVGCSQLQSVLKEMLVSQDSVEEKNRRYFEQLKTCVQTHRAQGVDFAQFTTPHNAADAADLMDVLHADPWDVYAISYGTRVALELMRSRPKRLRSVVLDGVFPPNQESFASEPWLYAHAWERVVKNCRADERCKVEYPELDGAFRLVLARLREQPLDLEVFDTTTLDNETDKLRVRVDDEVFFDLIFSGLYWWELAGEIPALVGEVDVGRSSKTLAWFIEDYIGTNLVDDSLSVPILSAVDCQDNGPFDAAAYLKNAANYPLMQAWFQRYLPYHACQLFTARYTPDTFRQPVRSEVPVLLLSGELDPVTPPVWADKALAHLPNGFHIQRPYIGHGVMRSDECGPVLVKGFLRDPSQKPAPNCLRP